MKYTVTIHFTSGTKTYAILRDGWELPDLVGAKGRHATQSLSLSILSKEAFALFLSETSRLVKAEVKKDDEVIFEGVVRPYLGSSAKGSSEDPIRIEVLDYTELLHFYIAEDSVLQNLTLDKVIDSLFSKAGVSIAREYPASFSTDATSRIPLSKDEYVDDILSTLLYERGYDYKFTPGKCTFFETSTETEPTASVSDIRGTLSIQRSDDWSDGLKVKYMKAKEDDVVIYRHEREESNWRNVGGTEFGYPGGIRMLGAKGLYYDSKQYPQDPSNEPPDGKAKVSWNIRYNESSKTDIKPIGLANVRVDASLGDEDGVSLTPHVKDVTLSGGKLWLSYSGDFDYHEIPVGSWFSDSCRWSWIWRITVTAHVAYLVADSEEIMAENGLRPDVETKNLTYIYTQALAKAYVQREMKRQKTSSLTYSFSSLTAYSAGGFYKLQDSVTGINTVVRILSCNQSADGLYSVKAESASTMSISDIALKELYYSDMESSPDTAFRIKASRTTFNLPTDGAELVPAGAIASSSEFSFFWTLGAKNLGEGESMRISGNQLVPGNNEVVCQASYDGVVVAIARAILLYVSSDGVSIQYAIERSMDMPPLEDSQCYWNTVAMYWGSSKIVWRDWTEAVPVPKDGEYLWMRVKVGDGPWRYSRLTGEHGVDGKDGMDAKVFSIGCDHTAVDRNDRLAGAVVYKFTIVVQGYDNANPQLAVNGVDMTSELEFDEDTGSLFYLLIMEKRNAKPITAILYDGTTEMDRIELQVVDSTMQESYIGVRDEAPSRFDETQSLLKGDWYVLKSTNVLYIWNGAAWEEKTVDSPDDFSYLSKVSIAMTDMIKIGTTDKTTATILGLFKYLAADQGFIKFLSVYNLLIDNLDGMSVDIRSRDEFGVPLATPVFDVKFKAKSVFRIDPSTGNVFMGSGFFYQSSDESIRSSSGKVVIDSNGQLIADNANLVNAVVSGVVHATSGLFQGSVDTPAFSSLPNETGGTTVSYSCQFTDAEHQLRGVYSFWQENNLSSGIQYECSLSANANVRYVIKTGYGNDPDFMFYDESMVLKEEIRASNYGTIAPGYRSTLTGKTFDMSVTFGKGEIFKFKGLQQGKDGLTEGQVYYKTVSGAKQLFVV